jgi:hypothetical protein
VVILTHILSDRFASPNGRGLLYPIVRHARQLSELGITPRFFSDARDGALSDCDTLIVDSKSLRAEWGARKESTLTLLASLRERAGRLLFFDTTDSAGWLMGDVLPLVDGYFKGQVLKDKLSYSAPMYGRRSYTHYYHVTNGTEDLNPEGLMPQVTDKSLLRLIRVSWNSGLADYSLLGPRLASLYQRLPLRQLLREPSGWVSPEAEREIPVTCRMGITYERATVRFQREQIRDRLHAHLRTEKLKRRAYFQEMSRSKVVVSPFGLGEITLKDFEVFICGALLLKPDMSHLVTWPDFYKPGQTLLTHRWDLSDLEEQISMALDNPEATVAMARTAQEHYKAHVTGPEAGSRFAAHFFSIVSGAECSADEGSATVPRDGVR